MVNLFESIFRSQRLPKESLEVLYDLGQQLTIANKSKHLHGSLIKCCVHAYLSCSKVDTI